MKITVFEVEEWEYGAFKHLENEHELEFVGNPLSADNADRYADTEILSPFIYSKLNEDVLRRFKNLKLIATRSTGFDHIAGDYCREKDVLVSNVPTYGKNTVAEHVFGLLLTISHKLVDAVDRTRRGDFSLQGLQGFDLLDKTLGVIGTGDIGQCVIEIAHGFRMKVLAYDVNPSDESAKQLDFQYVTMNDLLARSDIITLHVPAGPKTHHLIGETEFAKMKDGVVLINTARGTVVDIQAMVRAISNRKVMAAGLDVLPEEPVIREEAELLKTAFRKEHDLTTLLMDHIVLRLRNVVVTPHSAFNTREAVQRILDTTVDNIVSFVTGEPQNVVMGRDKSRDT